MTTELVKLKNEFNELADKYFPSIEAKQKWFKSKHLALGGRSPSELYDTNEGIVELIEELNKLLSGNLA